MEKIKVSAFEYVFMQAAAKHGKMPDIEKYEPLTRDEEMKRREDNIKEQFNKIANPPAATVRRYRMETKIYKGKINISTYQDDYDALFVGDTEVPFALLWNEELAGKTVNARYWISEREMTKEQLKENTLLTISGAVEADYNFHYSDITGFLGADFSLIIGGHDFSDILTNNKGKYLYMEVDIINQPHAEG